MIPVAQAIKIITGEVVALSDQTVNLEESTGRVLAEAVYADMDLPPFDRSQMDGFAVRSVDTKEAPVKLKIIGESVAGKGFDGRIKNSETARIMTGARVPGGADSVKKVELTREYENTAGEKCVEILEPSVPEENIVRRGEEIKKGTKIFSEGERVTENMIASLASFGYAKVKVFIRPQVSILPTGSEIVEIEEKPEKDQIRNSNSIMLEVFAKKTGAQTKILPPVLDDFEILKENISQAVGLKSESSKSEILIITGGVSVGDYDFAKPALRELGAEIFFERVSLKPGKPMVFARLNETLIFGLPGNPVSVAVTFNLFVRAAILQMQSARDTHLEKGFAVVTRKIKGAKERDSYLPALVRSNENGSLTIESLRFTGSSSFIAFSRANALVFVPQGAYLNAGEVTQILNLP